MKGRAPTRRSGRHAAPPRAALAPLPRTAIVLVAGVAVVCAVVTLGSRIYDMDLWQHLAYGRALWMTHQVPTTQQWTWPDVGAPEINASWGFRALLWPFWAAGGVAGLFAWRWILALSTLALGWLTARRLGARGLTPWVILALAALMVRQRAQIRPELLASLLLAIQIWILETRRQGGPDRTPWLVATAWVWANVHLSYPLGFAVLGIHLADEQVRAWRERRAVSWRLLAIFTAAAAVSFLNPFGVRGLAWPFQFAFQWRHEPLERDVTELAPLLWNQVWRSGVALWIVGWPLLVLSRIRRHGFDMVEAVTCALFTLLVVSGHRFVGTYAVAAFPYVTRDVSEHIAALPGPRAMKAAVARAASAAALCVGLSIPEWTNPRIRLGFGLDMPELPVAACDFMANHGVGGRGMNHFPLGGYQVWRFWPDRSRLPFFTIHTEYGTPERRALYLNAFFTRSGWDALDASYRFDYALLRYQQIGDDHLVDILDDDPRWALVFLDDAAAVYVRRDGPLADVARRNAYQVLGAGSAKLKRLNLAALSDSLLRRTVHDELERQVAGSPANSAAHTALAHIAQFDGRRDEAREHFRRALAVNDHKKGAHLGLGLLELEAGNAREAIVEFRAERRGYPNLPDLSFHIGRAYLALGDPVNARRWFRDELSRQPRHEATLRALSALGAP